MGAARGLPSRSPSCGLSIPWHGKPCQGGLSSGLKDLPGKRCQCLPRLLIRERRPAHRKEAQRCEVTQERLSQPGVHNQNTRLQGPGLVACPQASLAQYSLHSCPNHLPGCSLVLLLCSCPLLPASFTSPGKSPIARPHAIHPSSPKASLSHTNQFLRA